MDLGKTHNHIKTSIGQIFTPDYVAELMVNNVLKFIENLKESAPLLVDVQNLKVLEPSVGEGVFLKYLLQNKFLDIVGYEIDNTLKQILLKKYPNINFRFENFLGSDNKEQFDIVIGNPPYLGHNYNAEVFQDYIKNYSICAEYFVGHMDLFYYFIHHGISKLKPGGILSYITTNYWITKSKKTGIKLLKPHILNECYLVQYIDLSKLKPFKDATGQHNCIFVLQKKTEHQKLQNIDKSIEIIQIIGNRRLNESEQDFNKRVFIDLIQEKQSQNVIKYTSALTNNDLDRESSWHLLYPEEIKNIVDKIENKCKKDGRISLLSDFFIIRNGIIFIKDEIFTLNKDKNLKIENGDFFIKINEKFVKLSDNEKSRLKKLYKSKSIKPFGYTKSELAGYAIYFNKNDYENLNDINRNKKIEKEYPALAKYLRQHEKQMRETLLNAKENPEDIYFPRRGAFVRELSKNDEKKLTDLEPFYNNRKKIFFKFISNKNIFGYSEGPYYATSDTYFLWPKFAENELEYPFFVAYLNSKLVYFLFKAKNISIKRSKTKLENQLPFPNIKLFTSKEDQLKISSIKQFTSYLLNKKALTLKEKDDPFFQKAINSLFFQLFEINEQEVDALLNKYYK